MIFADTFLQSMGRLAEVGLWALLFCALAALLFESLASSCRK